MKRFAINQYLQPIQAMGNIDKSNQAVFDLVKDIPNVHWVDAQKYLPKNTVEIHGRNTRSLSLRRPRPPDLFRFLLYGAGIPQTRTPAQAFTRQRIAVTCLAVRYRLCRRMPPCAVSRLGRRTVLIYRFERQWLEITVLLMLFPPLREGILNQNPNCLSKFSTRLSSSSKACDRRARKTVSFRDKSAHTSLAAR